MNYISVRTFDNYLYANILLSRLKEEGFDCYLKDENTVTIDPLLSPAIGGIKLMVTEPEVVRAYALMDSIDSEYVASIPCPNCGSQGLQIIKKTSKPGSLLAALFYQLIRGSAETETRTYRCSNCGFKPQEIPGFTGH